ncbi:hypothetical protein Hanom_Chr17g01545931 [Helianthus anomalus]
MRLETSPLGEGHRFNTLILLGYIPFGNNLSMLSPQSDNNNNNNKILICIMTLLVNLGSFGLHPP